MNQHDEKFISELKTNLQHGEDNLDASTRSSLTQARNNALDEFNNTKLNHWRLPIFATATFASILCALSIFYTVSSNEDIQKESEFILNEAEYTAFMESSDLSLENIEEEIEFLEWLDEQEPS